MVGLLLLIGTVPFYILAFAFLGLYILRKSVGWSKEREIRDKELAHQVEVENLVRIYDGEVDKIKKEVNDMQLNVQRERDEYKKRLDEMRDSQHDQIQKHVTLKQRQWESEALVKLEAQRSEILEEVPLLLQSKSIGVGINRNGKSQYMEHINLIEKICQRVFIELEIGYYNVDIQVSTSSGMSFDPLSLPPAIDYVLMLDYNLGYGSSEIQYSSLKVSCADNQGNMIFLETAYETFDVGNAEQNQIDPKTQKPIPINELTKMTTEVLGKCLIGIGLNLTKNLDKIGKLDVLQTSLPKPE